MGRKTTLEIKKQFDDMLFEIIKTRTLNYSDEVNSWRRYRDAQGNVTKRIWVAECEAGSKAYGEKINDYNLQKSN